MQDRLRSGLERLRTRRRQTRAVSVTYSRGHESVTVEATVDRTTFDMPDATGVLHQVVSRDYIIDVADLVLADVEIEPEPGDVITEVIGAKTYTHEVRSPIQDTPWRHSNPAKSAYRIHTKQVSVA